MVDRSQTWFDLLRPHLYARRPPLILLNGLAEQAETWFHNHPYWRRYFEVYMPNLLVYDGAALHDRIAKDLPISVDYLVEQLHHYLEMFVQTPPYHFVASSLGGKIAVEYAARYSERVGRMVLLCPSGLGDEEQLPVVEGVRRNDLRGVIDSVFYDPRCVEADLLRYYQKQFTNRRWRLGLLRTIRGTMDHCIRDRMVDASQPTLLITGREDRIVSPAHAEAAARALPSGEFVCVPRCGHAPHMEKPASINPLVVQFLTRPRPATSGRRPISMTPAEA